MSWACRHCGRGVCNYCRGLCKACYYAPGVRHLYPVQSRPTHDGAEDFAGPAPPPEAPTDAPPGSREKVEVLAGRAARRQSLFHDGDSLRRVG